MVFDDLRSFLEKCEEYGDLPNAQSTGIQYETVK